LDPLIRFHPAMALIRIVLMSPPQADSRGK